MIFSFYDLNPANCRSVSIASTKPELSQYYVYGSSAKKCNIKFKIIEQKIWI